MRRRPHTVSFVTSKEKLQCSTCTPTQRRRFSINYDFAQRNMTTARFSDRQGKRRQTVRLTFPLRLCSEESPRGSATVRPLINHTWCRLTERPSAPFCLVVSLAGRPVFRGELSIIRATFEAWAQRTMRGGRGADLRHPS